MEDDVIRSENLSKQFKDVQAVSNLSLKVRRGEIYGFLGLNGAGKSTTIRMLLGLVRPASGSAYINGTKITYNNKSLWQHVGALVEAPSFYPELTVFENLEITRKLHFLDDREASESVMEKLRLTSYAGRKAKDLSTGNKQRLGLAKAMIHQPAILILDEPTNGLDPAGIYEIRMMLSALAKEHGVTVFISSHILGEISRFAGRIGIIHQGMLVREIDADELKQLSNKRLIVVTRDNDKARTLLSAKGYPVATNKSGQLEIKDDKAISAPEKIATLLVNAVNPPSMLNVEEEDLESFFLRTIGIAREEQ